jgi:hypothetical protein
MRTTKQSIGIDGIAARRRIGLAMLESLWDHGDLISSDFVH